MTGIHQTLLAGRREARPIIVDTTARAASGSDSVTSPIPDVVAGQLYMALVAFPSVSALGAPSNPSGLTTLFAAQGTGIRLYCFYKTLTGTESGNLTADLPGSSMDYVTYQLVFSKQQGGIEYVVTTSSSTTTPDSPNISPSWGITSQSLILAVSIIGDSGVTSPITVPTDYTLNRFQVGLSSGVSVTLGICGKNIIAASENPSAFSIPSAKAALSATFAIRAAA